ncbi:MAG: microcyclamide/patellamide family RiPP [Okeania sp. SIO3I5]|uniref:microcyclamide/patellamide family RiPP n=1 Tax=Okeania sp. SIO3I5 TaxID=2607805 RepID=UPI0013B7256A|nr:microcyclamide/patellamide family RiPP [Okeania sp. SIO3I5]NEQ40156.1 microcyclamide/patellamide family RiPP [Okeania sp. SIO3I5]
MGKKNIKPNLNQPVIRTNVAKPALEDGLSEENLTSATPDRGLAALIPSGCGLPYIPCSYDGDDPE